MKRLLATLFLVCSLSAALAAPMTSSQPGESGAPKTDFQITLTKLLTELKQAYGTALQSDSLLIDNGTRREQLAEMVRAADEVTIMLYTQQQDFAFDMAFALEKVSNVYESFKEKAQLSDKYLIASRSGLKRYSLLEDTLEDMYLNHPADSLIQTDSLLQEIPPFVPLEEEDPEKKALLDSCLNYTRALTALYGSSVMLALQDSIYFAETDRRLRQAYDFAQSRYAQTQRNIFIGGSLNIVRLIKNRKSFLAEVKEDLYKRFGDQLTADGQKESVSAERPWGGKNTLRHAGLALLALLLSFLLADLINKLIFKQVEKDHIRALQPILTYILAIIIFGIALFIFKAGRSSPYWRLAYRLLTQFLWLTLAIFVSLLIRVRSSQIRPSRNLYIPTLLLAFLTILLRAMLLPASLIPLILPPALLVFIVWQAWFNTRYRSKANRTDLRYTWVSMGVMSVACILSLAGYPMIGVLLLTFWTFQLALLHTITTLYFLIKRYYDDRIVRRKVRYHEENPVLPLSDENAFIEVTWLYDLLRMVFIPLVTLASIPASVQLTARAYQLSLAGADILQSPLFHREELQYLTPSNLLIVLALFFVFNYAIYLVRALLRVSRLREKSEKKGLLTPLKESDVNLSLPNALISLLGWFLYLVVVFSVLRIPTKALTYITTGLAAGVGFALKDLINNFFYGFQLMAGRIRVGDKISCDGVRGIVKRVSYQTTQVEDEDGSLIAFTNTDLFSKKFRNLNSGRNYEFLKIPVYVRYGTDIDFARKVILEALEPLMTQDGSGRNIVDPSFPVDVRFDGFGDSSVNLIVALYSTVETHYTFPSRAKEAIYNAFYKNGIEIPFPQQDVYIKSVPEEKA